MAASRPRRNGGRSARTRGVPVEILRLAGIYGPGRNALVKLREGDARRIVKPGQVFNRIHVDDIAGVALRAARGGGAGGVWNVADREPAPPQDVIAFAAGLMGVAPPPEEPFEGAAMSRNGAQLLRRQPPRLDRQGRARPRLFAGIPDLSRGPDRAVAGRRGAVNVA